MQLQYAGYTQEINTWEQYLRQNMGKWYDQFGTDNLGFIQFLQDNLDYVYCDPNAFFSWHIDEDVKKIGISNQLIPICFMHRKRISTN